jgi:hypothetical protein
MMRNLELVVFIKRYQGDKVMKDRPNRTGSRAVAATNRQLLILFLRITQRYWVNVYTLEIFQKSRNHLKILVTELWQSDSNNGQFDSNDGQSDSNDRQFDGNDGQFDSNDLKILVTEL